MIATTAGFQPISSPAKPMSALAWLCIVAGILLAIAAFLIAVNGPTTDPWPTLIAGFCVTAVGIVLLTREKRPEDGEVP